jgi:hypothetical protein
MAKHTSNKPAPAAPQAAPTAPATAPAPTATPASAAPANAALQVVYKAGKPYNVRGGTAQDNSRSWAAVQSVLQANGGQATRGQIVAAVQQFNHAPFVGYAIRRGWLAPAASAPAPSTTA